MLSIRAAEEEDREAVWQILEPVIRGGETYALPEDLSREEAIAFWFSADHEVFVALKNGDTVGTYFIHPNHKGGGSHVANCGYVTATSCFGRGIARAMCAHSLEHGKGKGFRAMQFNFVISTNERAVRLWKSFGFDVAGVLPQAFLHPTEGYVDALVMYRSL